MIYILLGDDVVASRRKFAEMQNQYKIKGYELLQVDGSDLQEIAEWKWDAQNLFADKKVFFTQNVLSKKKNREILKRYDDAKTSQDIVIWEEQLWERDVKFIFSNARIIVFKLPQNIFTFLDNLKPGNKKFCCRLLTELAEHIQEPVIFSMMHKRIRELIMLKYGFSAQSKQQWQTARLSAQAKAWSFENLFKFYDGLYKIEVSSKTSQTSYSIKQNLEILFCYYL